MSLISPNINGMEDMGGSNGPVTGGRRCSRGGVRRRAIAIFGIISRGCATPSAADARCGRKTNDEEERRSCVWACLLFRHIYRLCCLRRLRIT